MNNKGNLTDERPPLLPVIIGTGFGSGFWPWGPGTAGSVLATLIWAALAYGLGITGESLQSITFFLVIAEKFLNHLVLKEETFVDIFFKNIGKNGL